MALNYLIDTNIISEIERFQSNEKVAQMLHKHWNELAIAAVSWHELWYGYHRLSESKRKERVRFFIENTVRPHLPILPYEASAAEWFARERARLSKIGRTPAYADGQIAAVAATNDLTVVTRNVADFAVFDALPVENWFDAAGESMS